MFQNMGITSEVISDPMWEMFQALDTIKDTVERASEAEISPHIRGMILPILISCDHITTIKMLYRQIG